MFKIEKTVEIPGSAGSVGGPNRYPFPAMEVGDSFFVPGAQGAKAGPAAHTWGRLHGRKFATRKEGDGVRIWRIK